MLAALRVIILILWNSIRSYSSSFTEATKMPTQNCHEISRKKDEFRTQYILIKSDETRNKIVNDS